MGRKRKKLGELLVSWGSATEQQVEEALGVAAGSGQRIGEVMVDLGFASEDDVTKALATQFGLEFIDLENQEVISALNEEWLPADLVQKYHVLPIEKENNRLKVLIHDPMDLELMDMLRFRLNVEIDTALAAHSRIKKLIDTLVADDMGLDDAMGHTIDEASDELQEVQAGEEEEAAEDDNAPIIRLVNKFISDAVHSRASDIHIEPMSDRVKLRYRIDGVCHERDNIPKRMQGAVLARLKLMAGINIAEKRIPQDGRIKMRVGKDTIDFRVSSCPAYHGESVVLRILRSDSVKIGLANLGLEEDTLDKFNKIIRRPNGIFLVTGPTGSGKTTTLYTALDLLNRPDRKIITAEDPVEYNFPGINQCQVREEVGLSFARILKAMLRQAPNIVLVGEIRDKDVANVAIQAALTGHLVFSTLHTNDAPSAITRMIDMGVKPFLVASALQAVMGQRLVRVLCGQCKEPDPDPNKFYLSVCGFADGDLDGKTIYRPGGCKVCGGSGYKGRRGIYEFMTMNSEIRELAYKRASASELRHAAVSSGMRNLVSDGRMKILKGLTTPEEISRVAQVEGVVDVEEEELVIDD